MILGRSNLILLGQTSKGAAQPDPVECFLVNQGHVLLWQYYNGRQPKLSGNL